MLYLVKKFQVTHLKFPKKKLVTHLDKIRSALTDNAYSPNYIRMMKGIADPGIWLFLNFV